MEPSGEATLLKLHGATQRLILVVGVVLAPFAAGATLGAIDPDRWLTTGSGTTERIISGVLAVAFDLLLLFLLAVLPTVPRRILAFDESGVWQYESEAWSLTPWENMDRVGLLWSVKPGLSYVRLRYHSVELVDAAGQKDQVDLPALSGFARRVERALPRFRPQVWAGRRQVPYEGLAATARRAAARRQRQGPTAPSDMA